MVVDLRSRRRSRTRARPSSSIITTSTTSLTLKRTRTHRIPTCEVVEPPPLKAESRLVHWNDLPFWLQDNEHIHTGFRPASGSYIASFHSLCYVHNQTGNIFSHLIPFLAIACFVGTLYEYAKSEYPSATADDWAIFGGFFAGMALCYILSAAFHTFGNHSADAHGFWVRLDFLGIICVTSGTFIPGLWYTFFCEPHAVKTFWITADLIAQGVAAGVALFVPKFRTPTWRPVRAGLFVFMGSSGFYPIIFFAMRHGFARANEEAGALWCILAACLYGAGAAVYATRWPEKWWPGSYDIWGHSHQLFHVLIVLGLMVHFGAFVKSFDFHQRIGQC